MNKKVIMGVFMLFCICSGCKTITNEEPLINYQYNESEFLEKTIFIDSNELNSPTDIVCSEELIYVANQENNNILVFNYEGELLESFGTIGQGQSEFTKPVAIALNDEKIYIVDKDSCRIQVFDRKFNFVKEIIVDSLKNSSMVSAFDLEVDKEGNIFLTVEGANQELANIYKISLDGKVKKIGKKLIGVMDRLDDKIFFTSTYELYETKEQLGYRSGASYVSEINNTIDKVFVLTNKYTPTSIKVTEDKIYLFSKYMRQIDEFLYNGSYVRTLYREDASDENRAMNHMDMKDGCFYMTDSKNNVIYMFKHQGD